LLTGAQFLSVATVTVYAGAILVTFLFVIMLAKPRGLAHYDRVSWEAILSAATGAILVGLLTSSIGRPVDAYRELVGVLPTIASVEREDAAAHGILSENHVAHLGQELLGRHLISMQAAGALMFAALVGAVAIIAHGRKFPASIEFASGQFFQATGESRIVLPVEQERPAQREAAGGIHA
jgi:NADH-quinone oxidoreductase subunit J